MLHSVTLSENINGNNLPEAVHLLPGHPLIGRSLFSHLFFPHILTSCEVELKMQISCCLYIRCAIISCWLSLLILYLPSLGVLTSNQSSEYEYLNSLRVELWKTTEVKRSIQSIFHRLCQLYNQFGSWLQHGKGLPYLSPSLGLCVCVCVVFGLYTGFYMNTVSFSCFSNQRLWVFDSFFAHSL